MTGLSNLKDGYIIYYLPPGTGDNCRCSKKSAIIATPTWRQFQNSVSIVNVSVYSLPNNTIT